MEVVSTASLLRDAFFVISYLWQGDDLFALVSSTKHCCRSNYLPPITPF